MLYAVIPCMGKATRLDSGIWTSSRALLPDLWIPEARIKRTRKTQLEGKEREKHTKCPPSSYTQPQQRPSSLQTPKRGLPSLPFRTSRRAADPRAIRQGGRSGHRGRLRGGRRDGRCRGLSTRSGRRGLYAASMRTREQRSDGEGVMMKAARGGSADGATLFSREERREERWDGIGI